MRTKWMSKRQTEEKVIQRGYLVGAGSAEIIANKMTVVTLD